MNWSRLDVICLALISVSVFLIVYISPVDYSDADARGSLLTSQAIIQYQTIKLDVYKVDKDFHVEMIQGHRYYSFPIGTSIFATPFVLASNVLGYDLSIPKHDSYIQNILSSFSIAVASALMYFLYRLYLPIIENTLFVITFCLGSSIVSTGGTALWSANFTLVICILILILVACIDNNVSVNPYIMSFLLFAAFLCRPTSVSLILPVLAVLFLNNRLAFIQACLILTALSAIYIFSNLLEYGQLLPSYYQPSRIGNSNSMWVAFMGLLISPSRGILVFTPLFALIIIGLPIYFKEIKSLRIFQVCIVWIILHLIIIVRFPHWWGGHSYGSRLFTEIIPGIALLLVLIWKNVRKTITLKALFGLSVVVALLGSVSIYINTIQGLYNTSTAQWNVEPNIDQEPVYLFNWRYPQFLANPDMLAKRSKEYQLAKVETYHLTNNILPNSNKAIFENWYSVEKAGMQAFRWSEGHISVISFLLANNRLEQDIVLDIKGQSYGAQSIKVLFNDVFVGQIITKYSEFNTYAFSIPKEVFLINGDRSLNKITFLIPDATQPFLRERQSTDKRIIGFAVYSVSLRPKN
jgi:hypothetical protein